MTDREKRIQVLRNLDGNLHEFRKNAYTEAMNKLVEIVYENKSLFENLKPQLPSRDTPICWYPGAGLDFSLLAQKIAIPSDPPKTIKTFIFNDLNYEFLEAPGELANSYSLHYTNPPDPSVQGYHITFLGFESMIHFHENGKVVIFVKADIRHLENELITHGIPIDLVAFLHAGILMDDAPRELARLGVKFYLGDPPYFEAKSDYQLLDIPDAPMFFLRDHQIPPLNYRIQKIQSV